MTRIVITTLEASRSTVVSFLAIGCSALHKDVFVSELTSSRLSANSDATLVRTLSCPVVTQTKIPSRPIQVF